MKLLSVFGIRLLLLLVALFPFTTTANADGPASCSFSGIVKLDDSAVAAGTLVTAIVQGDEYHTHTPPGLGSSSYSITIQPPEGKSYPDGTEVTFKINGYKASQTGIFKAGSSIRLDLTASTGGGVPADARSATPLNIPLTVGVIFALLIAGGAAYYFVRLRRAPRGVTASERVRFTGRQYSSLEEHPKQAPSKPSTTGSQPRKAETERKPRSQPPIAYPEGVLQALALHRFPLQRTTPAERIITCPACHQEFTIWVPSNWTTTRRAHLVDGAPSYAKKTRTKWLFEFDLECPKGHKLHLDWTWK